MAWSAGSSRSAGVGGEAALEKVRRRGGRHRGKGGGGTGRRRQGKERRRGELATPVEEGRQWRWRKLAGGGGIERVELGWQLEIHR
jgi:hypothetical protein